MAQASVPILMTSFKHRIQTDHQLPRRDHVLELLSEKRSYKKNPERHCVHPVHAPKVSHSLHDGAAGQPRREFQKWFTKQHNYILLVAQDIFATGKERGRRGIRGKTDSAVSEWLGHLNPAPLDQAQASFRYDLPLIGHSDPRGESMESSSSLSRVSTTTADDSSTVRDFDKRDRALSWEKLRLRRIFKTATEDEKSKDLKSKLVPGPSKLPFREIPEFVGFLKEILGECEKSRPNKDSSAVIEKFKDKFHEWQSDHRLALMTNREFGMDIRYSMSANEAVLQRTIMLSIIDRCYIHDLFSFNCEGQWRLDQRYRLPVTGRMEHVTLPKPDLAVFFKLEALTGPNIWAPYPKEMAGSLRPDGGPERCFPFLFMEVKRSADNLESAFRANLHSASQALYNIFQWMSLVDLNDIFWENVRVFSIDLNAREIKLRVHRAAPESDNSLRFYFDDITSLTEYTRDQACQLVKGVLLDYAKSELYGILKNTFQKVSEREQLLAQQQARSYQNKRRAEQPQSQSSKRGRSRVGATVPPVPVDITSEGVDPASSFGASGLTI
ncbi:uncharacterized protein Z518_00871 [Rhinocladiella mackenziei CBS 650.93]|uniref:Rhinocladiella mackenziei CBS 650.93 unplaced genomic scaffold supercont1.1, whole genome shotgun sequence n=1 Tax=Rhinocladiella mackenziei CBS 650.93 TaxID=1442369 RepID=A0A0D2JJY8_9EURO|nr:uncharacterized protein Z518_00871 [Rhinocladiella mackenziei CBS 650.93]KIX09790.1 hypothetical protein Z518_00871 [Rhinocladiella mackenziei CBS 650.93]